MALLFVAVISAAASAAFFISVSDMKILFNRLQDARALREAERVLAEAEMEMDLCLAANTVADCAAGLETSVPGAAAGAVDGGFALEAEGTAGNFSTVVRAVYSAQNGAVQIKTWRRMDGGN